MPLPSHLIVSTDFDGTLTSPSFPDVLAPTFMSWLGEARQHSEVTWIINTGRCWPSLQAELERRKAHFWPDWVVLVEREIHQIHEGSPRPHLVWNNLCTGAHTRLFQKTQNLWNQMRAKLHHHENLQLVEDIGCPLGLIAHSEKQADQIEPLVLELIANVPELILVRNSIYFRFGHADFTKGSCLREIALEKNLDPQACYAAGDHCNDLSMLNRESAHFICCPANSDKRVKRQVAGENGHVSKLNYSEGVVDGLRYYFG